MKFVIITHTKHKLSDNYIYAYEPYVREMNLWVKNVDEVKIVAPFSMEDINSIESEYQFNNQKNKQIATSQAPRNDESERHSEQREAISSNEQIATSQAPRNDELIKLIEIPAFDITSLKNGAIAILKIPKICIRLYKAMKWADHIHLRCPGNIGLLGCFVQILFPNKPKTIKYAGNWDPNSKQPFSYKLQKWILNNTFLMRNAKVLVYGAWPNQSKNIIPFFTASYSEKEYNSEQPGAIPSNEQIATSQAPRNDNVVKRHSEQGEAISLNKQITTSTNHSDNKINFIYVGGLTSGKQPLLCVKVVHQLKLKGLNITLAIYGEGAERAEIEYYIKTNNLMDIVTLHGNASKDQVKRAYKKAHFLLFISKSEGWPKVVAEAMFWGCVPITSKVSCVPWMLKGGKRGLLVDSDMNKIVSAIEKLWKDKKRYRQMSIKAKKWSRQYTLETFEKEIKKILQ